MDMVLQERDIPQGGAFHLLRGLRGGRALLINELPAGHGQSGTGEVESEGVRMNL